MENKQLRWKINPLSQWNGGENLAAKEQWVNLLLAT